MKRTLYLLLLTCTVFVFACDKKKTAENETKASESKENGPRRSLSCTDNSEVQIKVPDWNVDILVPIKAGYILDTRDGGYLIGFPVFYDGPYKNKRDLDYGQYNLEVRFLPGENEQKVTAGQQYGTPSKDYDKRVGGYTLYKKGNKNAQAWYTSKQGSENTARIDLVELSDKKVCFNIESKISGNDRHVANSLSGSINASLSIKE